MLAKETTKPILESVHFAMLCPNRGTVCLPFWETECSSKKAFNQKLKAYILLIKKLVQTMHQWCCDVVTVHFVVCCFESAMDMLLQHGHIWTPQVVTIIIIMNTIILQKIHTDSTVTTHSSPMKLTYIVIHTGSVSHCWKWHAPNQPRK